MAADRPGRPRGLRRSPDFLLLWGGQTVSRLGSQVTTWALPLTAALSLGATPEQMGLLSAAGSLPLLLLGLPAGAWADRRRRRPILIAADLGRALLLAGVPLAACLGILQFGQLVLIMLIASALDTCFNVAYPAYLPALVRREQLLEANSTLAASTAVAQIAGPGLAGSLVQIAGGPLAILADALSFLVSALTLAAIRTTEPAPARTPVSGAPRREIGEGLRLLRRHPVLRTLAGTSAVFNLFDSALMAIYVLYLTRTLGVGPAAVGLIFVCSGAGGLLGALLPGRLIRAAGLGPVIVGGALVASVGEFTIALAGGPPALAAAVVVLGEGAVQGGVVLYKVAGMSLQQALVPGQLLGRVSAARQVLGGCAIPIGALIGGVLGERYGLRPTVVVAGAGTLLTCLWLLRSPVRLLRDLPAPDQDLLAER